MKTIIIKRLWKEHIASIRDYIVKKQLDKNQGIKIQFGKDIMTLTYEELKKEIFQCHKSNFKSKFNNDQYQLYDINFKPDSKNKKKDQRTLF